MANIKVGASKLCIDPSEEWYPIHGMFNDVLADQKYDECDCRALAIETDSEKVLMLVYELSHPPVLEGFVEEISKTTGFPGNRIFISATHNHTSPGVEEPMLKNPSDYVKNIQKLLHDQGLKACMQAVRTMRQARIGYSEIPSYVNTNRYLNTLCGYWVEARNLSGYSDKILSVINFIDDKGSVIASFLNHATHNTSAMCKDFDHKNKTTGNFSGIACKFVEQHFGKDAVAFWTIGAAGDQNPLFCHGFQYEYPDGYTTNIAYPDGVGFMVMEELGRMHGADCVRAISRIDNYSDNLNIKYASCKMDLPARYRVQDEVNMMPGFMNERQGGFGPRPCDIPFGTPAPAGEFPEMYEDPEKPAIMEMRILILNNIALIFVNAEIVSILGKKMKEMSPYKHSILITQTGKNEIGYIFDKTSKDIKVPMAYQCVVPGKSDDIILNAEQALFQELSSSDGLGKEN